MRIFRFIANWFFGLVFGSDNATAPATYPREMNFDYPGDRVKFEARSGRRFKADVIGFNPRNGTVTLLRRRHRRHPFMRPLGKYSPAV